MRTTMGFLMSEHTSIGLKIKVSLNSWVSVIRFYLEGGEVYNVLRVCNDTTKKMFLYWQICKSNVTTTSLKNASQLQRGVLDNKGDPFIVCPWVMKFFSRSVKYVQSSALLANWGGIEKQWIKPWGFLRSCSKTAEFECILHLSSIWQNKVHEAHQESWSRHGYLWWYDHWEVQVYLRTSFYPNEL